MMPDNRSPLMKRLAEIMPKKPEPQLDGLSMIPFRKEPIRMIAESFASWMGDDLPVDREELRAMLWTFGEILKGNMERMLNSQLTHINDLLQVMPMPPLIGVELKEKNGNDLQS